MYYAALQPSLLSLPCADRTKILARLQSSIVSPCVPFAHNMSPHFHYPVGLTDKLSCEGMGCKGCLLWKFSTLIVTLQHIHQIAM
jgi:hypothetical protein